MDDAALISHHIIPNPLHRDPAAARLAGSDHAVWEVVRDLIVARGNVSQVAADYGLPRDAVVAARTYYFRHAALIDARIATETVTRGDGQRAA